MTTNLDHYEIEIRQQEHQRIRNFIIKNSHRWSAEEQTNFIDFCTANSNTPELDLAIKQMFTELKT
jgi:hypothetical protein